MMHLDSRFSAALVAALSLSCSGGAPPAPAASPPAPVAGPAPERPAPPAPAAAPAFEPVPPPAPPAKAVVAPRPAPPPARSAPAPAPPKAAPPPPAPGTHPPDATAEAPRPAEPPAASAPSPPAPPATSGHARVGPDKCKVCHRVQFQSWATSPHAAKGLDCEGCHGNGGDYWRASVMRDRSRAEAEGLVIPDLSFCARCHAAQADAARYARVHAHAAR